MADYIVKDTELTNIANAIRTAGGTNNSLTFPNGFVSAVENIGGGGGGGESSDFSTAKITLVDPNGRAAYLVGAFYGTITDGPDTFQTTYNTVYTDEGSVDIVLYKGSAFIGAVDVYYQGGSISVSGNAEIHAMTNIIVTGDCTITIS